MAFILSASLPTLPGFALALSLSAAFVFIVYSFQTYYDRSAPKDPTDPSKIYNNLELQVDASQDEIRLLYLHPGDWNDELVCTLKAVELGNNPDYVALSYAWHEHNPSGIASQEATFGYVNIYSWWTMLMPRGTRKKLIKVNKGNLDIGANLELALRHMRSLPGGPAIAVFADAICINQSDLRDRSSQVTLLREIYRKAARVEIWLGVEREFSHSDASRATAASIASRSSLSLGPRSAPASIRTVSQREDESDTSSAYGNEHSPNFELDLDTYEEDRASVAACVDEWYQYYSRPKLFRTEAPPNHTLGFFCTIWLLSYDAFKTCGTGRRGNLMKRVPFLSDSTRKATLEVFDELMSRVWWNRLWVLQEMTIASDLVVRYGRFVMPWTLFSQASRNVLHHMHLTCCAEDFERLGRSDLELLQTYSQKIATLDRWRARWNRDAESSAPRISLLRLMRKFRDRETTNPRDKVYALLPLVNYWGKPKVNMHMTANYDLTVADVYKKVTKRLLSMEESLDVLVGNTKRFGTTHISLPSWVPDWSTTLPVDSMVERVSLYHASQGTHLQFRTFDKNSYLELRGVEHDTVAIVGDVMPRDAHGHLSFKSQEVFQAWKKLARLEEEGAQDYHPCIHAKQTGRLESKLLAFVRTMCMDSIYIDQDEESFDMENSSQCYERASPAFRNHVDGWGDQLHTASEADIDSDPGMIRTLPIPEGLASGFAQAEYLLNPLERSEIPGHREASSMDRAVETATISRRFFITRDGYMGLGPEDTRKGDHVFVLYGGSVPFILRDAGLRHVPGLDAHRSDRRASRDKQVPEYRGRGSFRDMDEDADIWSDCSSTAEQEARRNGIMGQVLNEHFADKLDTNRSRSISANQFTRQRRSFAPNGSYANEVKQYKPGLSFQTDERPMSVPIRPLSQCYEMVGDCFVHGIMDGEAVAVDDDGDGKAEESCLVYLV